MSEGTDAIATTVTPPATRQLGRWQRAFVIMVAVVLVFMLVGPIAFPPGVDNAHYVYLAGNMVQGRLSVDDIPTNYPDVVTWEGHKYLPLGPLPAVLLIPFLPLLLLGVRLVWIGYLFTALNVWLFYKVLGQAGVTGERRLWALLLFFASTGYLAVAVVGSSYFFAHITTVTFILAAIWETLGRRRPLVIGLLLGLAGMIRLTALFCLPFFLWLLWRSDGKSEADSTQSEGANSYSVRSTDYAIKLALLFLGVAGPILLIGVYNYLRFGNLLESGYNLATLTMPALSEARSYGLFSLVHIPKNLVMMIFQGPFPYPNADAPILLFPYLRPSPWGMGLLYTSPALLYAFRASLKNRLNQACLLGTLVGMLPIITYYGVGWIQFGFRYALDFLPFVLLLAARGFPDPMSRLSRILVLVGTAVCIWGSTFLLIWIFTIVP